MEKLNLPPIDQMNRLERRRMRKRIHLSIPGAKIPYVKARHGDLTSYRALDEQHGETNP